MRGIDYQFVYPRGHSVKICDIVRGVKKQIGIYSGTFDPIHSGHLTFAHQAIHDCKLDEIIFIPEPSPRNKNDVTDISHRVELIKCALGDSNNLSVIRIESDQFTVGQTLPELTALFPDAHFTFLFGSDVIKSFSNGWDSLETLLADSALAIGMRAGDTTDEIITVIDELKKVYDISITYTLINTSDTAVNSSDIRQGFKDIANLHADVSKYIENNKLYTS